MSVSVSASRFACLPDDDSADWKAPKSKSKGSAKPEVKKAPDNKPKDKAKLKAQQEAKDLQAMFGGQKKSKNKKKGKGETASSATSTHQPSPAPASAPEPSQEWKAKDQQQVEDTFSQAMQQAILLSQLDFEQKQELEQAKQELFTNGATTDTSIELLAELSKEERKRLKGAEKAKATMSLEQFQEKEVEAKEQEEEVKPGVYKHPRFRDRAPGERLVVQKPPKPLQEQEKGPQGTSVPPPPGNFFVQMEEAAVVALTREQLRESYLKQEQLGSESALVAQYREKLLDREQELAVSQTESQELRAKLAQAKQRTKKLTEILMQAEMREKTEVLVQVHKLETVRDELSAQLSRTLTEQEQERSLVSALEQELRRVVGGVLEQDTAARLLQLIRTVKK